MLNKVMLIGRLGSDPETRYMPNGDPVTTISLATSRRCTDRATNEKREEVEWHRITFFSGLAKVASEYLRKGSQVYVEGRIRTNKWQKDGVDQYSTGIIGETMNMLDSKPSGGDPGAYHGTAGSSATQKQQQQNARPSPQTDYYGDDFDDNIPFDSLNWQIRNHLI